MRASLACVAIALLAAIAAVCGVALGGCGTACARNSDCANGLVCSTLGACVVPPSDGGTDGGSATMVDAAVDAIDAPDAPDASIDAPPPVMVGAPGSAAP